MNRKYLLRGIGIGVIIGSLTMYVAFATSDKTGDASNGSSNQSSVTTELKAENETTEEKTTEKKTEEKTTEAKTTEEKTTEKKTEEKTTEAKTTEEKTTEEKTTEEPTTEEKTTEEPATEQASGVKTITVSAGMGSEEVSALLKEAGLIKDDVEFNDWLISNGYADRISVGTFEIKVGSTNEEIARILTNG